MLGTSTQGLRARTSTSVLLAALLALVLASCTFVEGEQYTAFDAPPNGVHITVYRRASNTLAQVQVLVSSGINIDAVLDDRGLDLRCPTGGSERGFRCAFRILQETSIEVDEGGVSGFAKETVAEVFWGAAVAEGEYEDFRDDGLTPVLATYTGDATDVDCVHLTIRAWATTGGWDVSPNWTHRARTDGNCRLGEEW